jgi:hypothetical protein
MSHLKQHAETWEEYNELFVKRKNAYFDDKVKRINTVHMYINTNQGTICFTISLLIVDIIIKEMFYHDDDQILASIDEVNDEVNKEDEEDHHMNMERIRKKAKKNIALKHNAMKLFKLNENNEMYMVNILNLPSN